MLVFTFVCGDGMSAEFAESHFPVVILVEINLYF